MDDFIGKIKRFGGNFAPRGWLFCDGAILQIDEFPLLFKLLGHHHGGDGVTTFGVPDKREKVGNIREWKPDRPVWIICWDGVYPVAG